MKRLYLLRHAHAPYHFGMSDVSRQLSNAGVQQARDLGCHMKREGFLPDLALCSDSPRTRKTLEGVQQEIDIARTKMRKILYTGSIGDYFAEIQGCDSHINSILVIAHNPAIYGLVGFLANVQDEALANRLSFGGYPPATLSVLDAPCGKWSDIQPKECPLRHIIEPGDY